MNALFITQALGLKLHYDLMRALSDPLSLDRIGFYVCDSMFFRRFAREHPELISKEYPILKEWEIIASTRQSSLDLHYLHKLEAELNQGPLWDALVCDRRIMQGRWVKERQDYRPRFTHEQMLKILQVALEQIERMFDEVGPDIVFSFVPVTFGEYLFYLIAKARGVPILFLYPTKIENYMAWMSDFFGRPDHIVNAYLDYQRNSRRDEWVKRAEQYLNTVEGGEANHEGMVAIPGKIEAQWNRESSVSRGFRFLRNEIEYWLTESRNDNHVSDGISTLFYRKFLYPLRTRLITSRLSGHYVSKNKLESMDYAFYPLHAEPEVALSIQGKPYQNQIETVRNLARSLPVGMKLVVKEHPRCIGYRPFTYYEKLLRIPNVLLADPFISSKTVTQHSRLVVMVWSFVGFEAILNQKPVIALGTPTFTLLPDSMIRHVLDLNRLHTEITLLLKQYRYERKAVVHFIAANMRGAVPMDFYSLFLGKRGRYIPTDSPEKSEQFNQFISYTIRRVRDVCETGKILATPSS